MRDSAVEAPDTSTMAIAGRPGIGTDTIENAARAMATGSTRKAE